MRSAPPPVPMGMAPYGMHHPPPIHHESLPAPYGRGGYDDRRPVVPERPARSAYRSSPYPDSVHRRHSMSTPGPYGAPPGTNHYPPSNPYPPARPLNGSPLVGSAPLMHGSGIGSDYGHHHSTAPSSTGSPFQAPVEIDSLSRSPGMAPLPVNWSNSTHSTHHSPSLAHNHLMAASPPSSISSGGDAAWGGVGYFQDPTASITPHSSPPLDPIMGSSPIAVI